MKSAQPSLSVEVLSRSSALSRLPGELAALGERALERNIFVESLMWVPALELIDRAVELRVVALRDQAGVLRGVVALALEPLRPGIALQVLRPWSHRYCFLCTPLIDADAGSDVMVALAHWIASGAAPAGAIEWAKVAWDGPVGALIREHFSPANNWVVDSVVVQRAVLDRAASGASGASGRHTKEHRRLERRLGELGALHFETLAMGGDWQGWFEEFLTLEASGWKGAEGSAIRSRPEDREFFRQVVERADATGQLQMLAMRLDGNAIAMKLNLRSGAWVYCLKIAHDERFAKYSPGVLLELFNIRQFNDAPTTLLYMDSCANPNHSMIDRLWAARREIGYFTAARRGTLIRAAVSLRPLIRRTRRRLAGAGTMARGWRDARV